ESFTPETIFQLLDPKSHFHTSVTTDTFPISSQQHNSLSSLSSDDVCSGARYCICGLVPNQ
ncbi:unnamed protein product, partial [Brugia timori]|uniref:Ovule protein n=1 Tax=Brugia timori TaxID=42155 RepID=A0A0R3Q8L4_9BILA